MTVFGSGRNEITAGSITGVGGGRNEVLLPSPVILECFNRESLSLNSSLPIVRRAPLKAAGMTVGEAVGNYGDDVIFNCSLW